MINLESLIGRLGNVPHFKRLPESALKEIVYAGQILSHPKGAVIFSEGEPSSGMYVLFRGQVHLCKLGLQGQEAIVARIKPVIMFNEVPTIDGGPNPVTAVAVQDCTTWNISYERYQMLMGHYPELGIGLLQVLAARNRLLFARYEDLLSLPVLGRVAKILLDLSGMGVKPIDRSVYTNQKIAALAATVPEAVSRSIKTLREMELLDSTRNKITIRSAEGLADIAQVGPMEFETELQP
jgi:CRP/FNR family transcriptional regulator